MQKTGVWIALAGLLVAGCAATPPGSDFAAADPYESVNRVFHKGNVTLDRYVLRPVSQGYGFVTPTLFKVLVGNGFNHIDLIGDTVNHGFQGDGSAALRGVGRFTINTVLGAGGLLDPATEFGLPKEDTDFGITLGTWGVGEGGYLVLPFLGPATVRDLAGSAVDRALDPLSYVGPLTALDGLSPALSVVEIVDARDRNADLVDEVLYESADSYVTLRSVYLQRRRSQIAGDTASLPDIFDTPGN